MLREAIKRGVDLNYVLWGLINLGSEIKDVSCMDWSKLSGFDWRELLVEQPQFGEYCDWSLRGLLKRRSCCFRGNI